MEDVIKDYTGKIIGYIRTDNLGNKTVYNFYRKILGKYHKASNTTRDFYGRIVAYGDQSAMLLNMK